MHRAIFTGATLLFAGSALMGHATPTSQQQALQWGPAPAVFPKGAEMAVVSGDPSKAAQFAVQLKMPDGYTIPPHFHPTAEVVEVKSGTFLYAMGDKINPADMKPMTVGQSGSIPANTHHYARAKGATIVQVSGMGPFALIYVNAADDPQKAAPAKP